MSEEQLILHINDNDFETVVIKSDKPVIVDFWASWCGPCKAIAPLFEELATKYSDKIKFVKLNVDENSKTPTKYGVKGIPTLLAFKNGNVTEQIVGMVSMDVLDSFVKKISA